MLGRSLVPGLGSHPAQLEMRQTLLCREPVRTELCPSAAEHPRTGHEPPAHARGAGPGPWADSPSAVGTGLAQAPGCGRPQGRAAPRRATGPRLRPRRTRAGRRRAAGPAPRTGRRQLSAQVAASPSRRPCAAAGDVRGGPANERASYL